MTTITQDKKDIDTNGYITYYDVPMTRAGVFPYLGRTISPELEPDRVYNVLRPIEELSKPETLKSLEAIPFVIDHTMLGEGFTPPEDKGIEGTTLNNVKVNGDIITNDLTAYTDRCKKAIENGKRDLSLGYRCKYELSDGTYNGQPYDAIQRDIIFNHVALVDEGRMGKECSIQDNSITYDSIDILKEKTKMTKFTLDEDLKEELKEEIKKELLGSPVEEVIEEKKEDVVDEDTLKPESASTADEDTDKRKLIDEIGGILNGKVDEEILRTILQKVEEVAYNPSETGANDACNQGKDEEEVKEEEKEVLSMDSAIRYIAKRDSLADKLRPVIGDNANYKSMTIEEVVAYACDKLDIKPSLNRLEGYLAAVAKNQNIKVTVATDSALKFNEDNTSASFKDYLNGK